MNTPLLQIKGLCKWYAAPVLDDVFLDVVPGEVHALVGANGAGKSTIARIVSGLTESDGGELFLSGQPFAPKGKAQAEAAGVQIVMQELNLIETLSVAENLFLNRLPRRLGLVASRALYEVSRKALDAVGLHNIDPRFLVGDLGVGQQQLLEIAAALSRDCRLLILDEPTAALTDPQIDLLFDHIIRLKNEGVGLIYISHRLEELRRITDRVTILRDGRVVTSQRTTALSLDQIIRYMVGRKQEKVKSKGDRKIGLPALCVSRLCSGKMVRNITFCVSSGEILGLAGLVGSGRTETLRAIFGADRLDSGEIRTGNEQTLRTIRKPYDAVRAGIGLIPEDRKQHGLLLSQPVRVNMTLARIRLLANAFGWIDSAQEQDTCRHFTTRLQVQSHSIEQPAEELSGGNQQKVVIARWLFRDCDVLLFDEPTRGIDIEAKQAVYTWLDELACKGKALVVVSSDLRELMTLCDRIAVLSAGKLVRTFLRDEWTHDDILAAAFSGYT